MAEAQTRGRSRRNSGCRTQKGLKDLVPTIGQVEQVSKYVSRRPATLVEEVCRRRSPHVTSLAHVWKGQIRRSMSVSHALTFRQLELVALLIGGRRSLLGGQCHPTLSLDGCFKKSPPWLLYFFLKFFLILLKSKP